jgi:hypothetical protein
MKEKRRLQLLEKRRREAELSAAMSRPLMPNWESNGIDPSSIPSSSAGFGDGAKRGLIPGRLTGEMIFTHKTAPVLQIHGRSTSLSPDDYASGRRR